MANNVVRNPPFLSLGNFVRKPGKLRDPSDGSEIVALTRFSFTFPTGAVPRSIGGQIGVVFPPKWQLLIRPDAKIWKGLSEDEAAALLDHEQLHYLFGFITGRALMNDIATIRAKGKREMKAAMDAAVTLHMQTRALDLNVQYDDDTDHGHNSTQQSRWQKAMDKCLLDDNATDLLGLPL